MTFFEVNRALIKIIFKLLFPIAFDRNSTKVVKMLKKSTSKKPVVLLSIETKARELPGKVLLSCFLAEKGFRVVLTNYRKIPFVLKTGAWLYIDRNSFAPRMSFFYRLKFLGFNLVCIDEEGIIWRNPDLYKSRIHIKTNKFVDMYFTWGRKQTELIKDVSSSINTVVTGNPRVDLLRPELKAMYKNRADSIKLKHGDYILLVSNFATNNNFYSKEAGNSVIDILVNDRRRQGLVNSLEDENDFRDFYKNRQKVFDKVISLIKTLSKKFPDLKIIVRPHPSENHENWKELMAGFENVHIVYEGELTPWIIAAKAVLHNSCTTGVEAALLGIKAIAYVPIDEPEFEAELPNSVSAAVSTEKEVIELIEKSPMTQVVPKILEEYIASIRGTFACENIADEIDKLYGKKSFFCIIKRKIIFRNKLISRLISGLIKKWHDFLNKAGSFKKINKSAHFTEYKKQKLEHISADECNDLINQYSTLLNRFKNIQVDEKKGYIEIS